MAKNPITKEEVLNKFLVTSMYTVPAVWPRETVAACKIICTDGDGNQLWEFYPVYRSNEGVHAEEKIIEYLENIPPIYGTRKIKFNVYSNYSPCKGCADKLVEYVKERRVEMTYTFANFFKIHKHNAYENLLALKALYEHPQVELRLFGVHVGWERFLGMSEIFHLTGDEKNECLDKAESPRRKDRERQDQKVWDYVFRD